MFYNIYVYCIFKRKWLISIVTSWGLLAVCESFEICVLVGPNLLGLEVRYRKADKWSRFVCTYRPFQTGDSMYDRLFVVNYQSQMSMSSKGNTCANPGLQSREGGWYYTNQYLQSFNSKHIDKIGNSILKSIDTTNFTCLRPDIWESWLQTFDAFRWRIH